MTSHSRVVGAICIGAAHRAHKGIRGFLGATAFTCTSATTRVSEKGPAHPFANGHERTATPAGESDSSWIFS